MGYTRIELTSVYFGDSSGILPRATSLCGGRAGDFPLLDDWTTYKGVFIKVLPMYPANFFGLFPPFPREKKVFVAMSFDNTFQRRWNEVIRPAVSEIELDGVSLEPVRVDVRSISDSIVTEILQGMAHHLVVFADVTTIAYVGDKPIRNANVLYEVGLAHAIRLPEEVILFRSDEDQLIFDITNVRVNSYDPDADPSTARELVIDSITNALKEIDLKRHHLCAALLSRWIPRLGWCLLKPSMEALHIR